MKNKNVHCLRLELLIVLQQFLYHDRHSIDLQVV